jgi:hypothetical protein
LVHHVIFKIDFILQALAGKLHMNVGGVKKPIFYHLKMFGCIVYAHGHDNTQRKLELKFIQCVFIGYGENVGVKGYILYTWPHTKKIVVGM